MKRIKIFKEFDHKGSLSEIYQSSGMRFAFISAPRDGNEMCHPWVKCRDFLHDAVRTQITGKESNIYGFKYIKDINPPVDTRRIRMIIKDAVKPPEEFKKSIKSGLKLINHYESLGGFQYRTKAYKIKGTNIWYVNGPSTWLKSPALVSMFTFLLRLGDKHIKFDTHAELIEEFSKLAQAKADNDGKYLYYTYDVLEIVIKNYREIFLEDSKTGYDPIYHKSITIDRFHNNGGIVSLCKFIHASDEANEILKDLIKEAVHMKPKLKIVEGYGSLSIYDSYDASTSYFSFVSNPKEGRKECMESTTCREILAHRIRVALDIDNNMPNKFGPHDPTKPQVDMKRLRMLLRVPGLGMSRGKMSLHRKKILFAKKLINVIEREVGIKRTVLSTVKVKYPNGKSYAWLFTGAEDWMKDPTLWSIFISLIRIGKKASDVANEKDEYNTLESVRSLYENTTITNKNDRYLIENFSRVLDILRNRDKIFTEGVKEAYLLNTKKEILQNKLGIISLMQRKHENRELVKRYEKHLESN